MTSPLVRSARFVQDLWHDVRMRMIAYAFVANGTGALFSFGYLFLVAPLRNELPFGTVAIGGLLGFMMLSIGGMETSRVIRERYQVATAWTREDRLPTGAERRMTLRLPLAATAPRAISWALAAVAFAGWSLGHGASSLYASEIVVTILVGGLVSCVAAFFLMERAVTPLIARTLQGESPEKRESLGIRARLLIAWGLGSAVPLISLAFLPLDAHAAAVHGGTPPSIAGEVVAVSLAGLLAGSVLTLVSAASVAAPVDHVRDGMRRVERGFLDGAIDVEDGGEIGLLQSGFNRMVAGLREREQLRDLFGRHVGSEVAQLALEKGSGLGGEQRDASVLFVDLVGSTAMAEVLPPGEVVATLNAFFAAVVEVVSAHGGWVNKFEGDGALCVFGVPLHQPDHASRALAAARQLDRRIRDLERDHPGLVAAIGVSAGNVVAGNVGTEQRYEYTVIGPAVNEAARLTDIAKGRSGRVLASAGILHAGGGDNDGWSPVGSVALRGKAHPTQIYEPSPSRVT